MHIEQTIQWCALPRNIYHKLTLESSTYLAIYLSDPFNLKLIYCLSEIIGLEASDMLNFQHAAKALYLEFLQICTTSSYNASSNGLYSGLESFLKLKHTYRQIYHTRCLFSSKLSITFLGMVLLLLDTQLATSWIGQGGSQNPSDKVSHSQAFPSKELDANNLPSGEKSSVL